MKKSALLVWGGWPGHSPGKCAELFGPWLQEQGYEVEISDTLDACLDLERLNELGLIVPIWTQGGRYRPARPLHLHRAARNRQPRPQQQPQQSTANTRQLTGGPIAQRWDASKVGLRKRIVKRLESDPEFMPHESR